MTQAAAAGVEPNRGGLLRALDRVRQALTRHRTAEGEPLPEPEEPEPGTPLARLSALFRLSPFERDILLLCAGAELEGSFSALISEAAGDPLRPYPTFSLALAALPGAHWSALTPDAPLRRWGLIEVLPAGTLTLAPLRIDERILHYLAGAPHADARLQGVVEAVSASTTFAPSHRPLLDRILTAWRAAPDRFPVIQLCGIDRGDQEALAAAAARELGLGLWAVRTEGLPSSPGDQEALVRLLDRESALHGGALLLSSPDEDRVPAALVYLVEHLQAPLFLATRDPRPLRRPTVPVEIAKPTPAEQREAWERILGPDLPALNGAVDRILSQFNLRLDAIRTAASDVSPQEAGPEAVGEALWDACRRHSRSRMEELAQRIEPAAGWEDLVLPEPQKHILREIAAHVRQRSTVYDRWGFAGKGERGLGITSLFAGASGTGKTMAAEVLARELRLDLYRVDLSAVVSKYIGETEKNLRRIFDAADEGGAILLFDEADALFGKRSEVKDSHDRYANIEVGYLLQRMECYRGLAILTTNMKSALDPAFLRRLRFVVQFPFPDAAGRAEIWRRVFPEETPTEDLSPERLARLNVAGGNIRNIALNAAFLAADAGEPVRMSHLLQAARSEYAKLEKSLTESETAGWL